MGVFADPGQFRSQDVEYNRMVTTGVESTRSVVLWAEAQPYRSLKEVPAGQLSYVLKNFDTSGGPDAPPTDYRAIDRIFTSTSSRRLNLLPVVLQAPDWAAKNPRQSGVIGVPRDPNTYGNFLKVLIRRYGTNGKFWEQHTDLPYRPQHEWQIWNEPNFPHFWPQKTWRSDYVKLLKASKGAIRSLDSQGKVVLAGVAGRSWIVLQWLYKLNARPYFDIVADHIYTLQPANVVQFAKNVRVVMNRNHDRSKQQMITELSWPSSKGKTNFSYPFVVTERQQAQKVRDVYPLLSRARNRYGISRVYWYTWVTKDRGRAELFDYAGLRKAGSSDSRAKPVFDYFRRAAMSLEGCRHGYKRNVTTCK